MQIQSLVSLQWKSFIRHPLFMQTIVFRLLTGVYALSLFAFLYFFGMFIEQWTVLLFSSKTDVLIIFLFSVVPLLILDFILKFLFKKSKFNLATLRRFPDSNKNLFIYSIMREVFNLWNWYLSCFFIKYLAGNIYPYYGLWITTTCFVVLCFLQISVSLWVNYIKHNRVSVSPKYRVANRILPTNEIANYLSLNIKMISRSPRLRQQFFTHLLLLAFGFYNIANNERKQFRRRR